MKESIHTFIICAKDKYQEAKKLKEMMENVGLKTIIDIDAIDVNNPTWAKDVLDYISEAEEIVIILSEGLDASTFAGMELNYIDEQKASITLQDLRNDPSYKLKNKRLEEFAKKYTFSLSKVEAKSKWDLELDKADAFYDDGKFKEAFKIYSKFAKKGDSYATWMVADMCESGRGTRTNLSKAAELFVSLAADGDILAAVRILESYLIKGDNTLANMVMNFVKSHGEDHPFTRICDVHCMINGVGVIYSSRRIKKGLAMAEEFLKEYPGNPVLMGVLGDLYYYDKRYGDLKKAHECYTIGYENGNPKCAFALALEILPNAFFDLDPDPNNNFIDKDAVDKAFAYLDEAAEAGYVPAEAMKRMMSGDLFGE